MLLKQVKSGLVFKTEQDECFSILSSIFPKSYIQCMKLSVILSLCSIALLLGCTSNSRDTQTTRQESVKLSKLTFFEWRTYYCYPDRLDNLLARFENHTMELFEKHRMVNLGYWVPIDNQENKLVYLMGYAGREQRDQAWEAFRNDPVWKDAKAASEEDGPIVDSITNWFMTYTDYSPKWSFEKAGPRIFSHRTYYTHSGKLEALHARFRDQTLGLFEKNGMTNIAYFDLDPGHPDADRAMTYFITFPDTTARKESWESFLADPDWKTAYANSIQNGPLVDTITHDLLLPTSFSPTK